MACSSCRNQLSVLSIFIVTVALAQESADTVYVSGSDTTGALSLSSGTVHSLSSGEIGRFPFRGLQNYLALFPGVIQQDGSLYVRGSRRNDLGYVLNGTSVTNRFTGLEGVQIIPEAMQLVELFPGIRFANAGNVYTTMKTGGDEFRLSVKYLTDDFAKPGKQLLGTSAYGFRTAVLTAEGPMPLMEEMKFFVAGEHRYLRNRRPMWLTPFSFQLQTEQTPSNPVPMDLPGPVAFPQNYVPNSWIESNTVQGTLTYDREPFAFQFTGSYQKESRTQGGEWPSALARIFNQRRTPTLENGTTFLQLRAAHKLSDDFSYDFTVAYQRYASETLDPDFGSDWQSYTDSSKNARKGYTGFTSYWRGPEQYRVINYFLIDQPGKPNNSYAKNDQQAWTFSGNALFTPLDNLTLSLGGNVERWTMRLFDIRYIHLAMERLFGSNGNSPPPFGSAMERRAMVGRDGRINHYGYDVDGKMSDDAFDGPRTPVFATAYARANLRYADAIIELGMRFERYDLKMKTADDPRYSDFDHYLGVIDESKLTDMEPSTLYLPRLSLTYPISGSTVLFGNLGETAQMPPLNLIYAGNTYMSNTVSLVSSGSIFLPPYTMSLKPERTTHFELGLRQKLPHGLEIHGTLFLKSMRDLLAYARSEPDGGGFAVWRNSGEASIKGIELSLALARRSGMAVQLHYTLSSARGTGSTPNSNMGRVEQRILGDLLLTPLDFNQTHKGTLHVDYLVPEETHPILDGLGMNLILNYNSGHNYTRIQDVFYGSSLTAWTLAVPEAADPRLAFPAEPINSSTTPPVLNIDLRLSKRFHAGGLDFTLFLNILNLFNTKHVFNVYSVTGSPEDDGTFASRYADQLTAVPNYEAFYRAINLQNRWAYMGASGNDIYGTPRQIRLGLNVNY